MSHRANRGAPAMQLKQLTIDEMSLKFGCPAPPNGAITSPHLLVPISTIGE